jgi:hypothetical protein
MQKLYNRIVFQISNADFALAWHFHAALLLVAALIPAFLFDLNLPFTGVQ